MEAIGNAKQEHAKKAMGAVKIADSSLSDRVRVSSAIAGSVQLVFKQPNYVAVGEQ
jgi:hypothetical protein